MYGAVCPKDGTCVYLIMPTSNTACFQIFLNVLSRKFARQDILLVLDGAPNHRCGDLALLKGAPTKVRAAALTQEDRPNWRQQCLVS